MSAAIILVVEDEFLIRLLLADALRQCGYSVIEAVNADEAMDVLESAQQVDLIITDVQMPGSLDGMDLTRYSKQRNPSRPVIVCSGHLSAEASQPADMFFAKPYFEAEIIGAAEKLMGTPCQNPTQDRDAS